MGGKVILLDGLLFSVSFTDGAVRQRSLEADTLEAKERHDGIAFTIVVLGKIQFHNGQVLSGFLGFHSA